MKFTIEGFSQARAVELKLDATDLLILRWLVDFANTDRMVKMQVGGKVYFWVKYEGVLEELPILNLKKDSLYRRLMKMVEAKILEHTVIKQGGTYSMYRLGENYLSLVSGTLSEINPTAIGNKSDRGTEINPYQNNNLQDKDKNKPLPTVKGEQAPSGKKSYAEILSAEDNKYVKEALEKFLKYCRGKNYTPKIATVMKFAETLRDNAGEDPALAMAIVDQSIDKGWKALYPLKKYGGNSGGVKRTAVYKPFDPEKDKRAVGADGKELVY